MPAMRRSRGRRPSRRNAKSAAEALPKEASAARRPSALRTRMKVNDRELRFLGRRLSAAAPEPHALVVVVGERLRPVRVGALELGDREADMRLLLRRIAHGL